MKEEMDIYASINIYAPPASGGNATAALLGGFTDTTFFETISFIKNAQHWENIFDVNLWHGKILPDGPEAKYNESLQSERERGLRQLREAGTAVFKELPGEGNRSHIVDLDTISLRRNSVLTIFTCRDPARQATSVFKSMQKDIKKYSDPETGLRRLRRSDPEDSLYMDQLNTAVNSYTAGRREKVFLLNYDDLISPLPYLSMVQQVLPTDVFRDVENVEDLLYNWRDDANPLKRNMVLLGARVGMLSAFAEKFANSKSFLYEPYEKPVDISHLPESWQGYVKGEAADIFQQLENHPLNMRHLIYPDLQNTGGR